MREKLIDIVETHADFLDWDTKEDMVDSIMDAFATDNNVGSKWISVKDRLPEKDGNYLIFERGYLVPSIRVLSFAKDGRKIDKYDFHREWKNVWYRYDSEWGHITVDAVTHWMHLPAPPKGE
jgi:hypothetical protein